MQFQSRTELEKFARTLRTKLEKVFAPDTAASGFAPGAPSSGHCAVVSVVVYDLANSSLVSADMLGVSHWFNRVRIGDQEVDVDITGDQFDLPKLQIAEADRLYPAARVRHFDDLTTETLERALILAGRLGLGATGRRLKVEIGRRREPSLGDGATRRRLSHRGE